MMETTAGEGKVNEAETTDQVRRLRGLQVLHGGAIVLALFLLWAFLSVGSVLWTPLGFMLCFFLVLWLAARFLTLLAEYRKAVDRIKIQELFPAKRHLLKDEGAFEEEARKMDLDAYKT